MKILKLSLFSLLLIGFFQINLNAQHEPKFNMLNLVYIGAITPQYEYCTENVGFIAEFSYQFADGLFFFNEGRGYKAISFSPGVRYYFDPEEDASGFYLGGYLKFETTSENSYIVPSSDPSSGILIVDQESFGLAAGPELGFKWVRRGGLVYDLGVAAGYFVLRNFTYGDFEPGDFREGSADVMQEDIPSLDLRLNMSIGYRF